MALFPHVGRAWKFLGLKSGLSENLAPGIFRIPREHFLVAACVGLQIPLIYFRSAWRGTTNPPAGWWRAWCRKWYIFFISIVILNLKSRCTDTRMYIQTETDRQISTRAFTRLYDVRVYARSVDRSPYQELSVVLYQFRVFVRITSVVVVLLTVLQRSEERQRFPFLFFKSSTTYKKSRLWSLPPSSLFVLSVPLLVFFPSLASAPTPWSLRYPWFTILL